MCSTAYTNGALPTSSFGGPTAFAYWDDLMIYGGTSQCVYYNVAGTAPSRTTTFEFLESHYGVPSQYYHFQVIFDESLPGVVQYYYFQSSDGGVSATIGVQSRQSIDQVLCIFECATYLIGSSSGPAMTYAMNQANSVTSNMTLIFDTNVGTFVG